MGRHLAPVSAQAHHPSAVYTPAILDRIAFLNELPGADKKQIIPPS